VTLNANSVLERAWLVSEDLDDDGQVALFDEQRSELLVLNGIGGAVWHELDGQITLGELAQALSEAVSGAPDASTVLAEVSAFAEGMLARGALRVVR
jgi:Coenzyme PQQ synthesis protein D (PqqD)